MTNGKVVTHPIVDANYIREHGTYVPAKAEVTDPPTAGPCLEMVHTKDTVHYAQRLEFYPQTSENERKPGGVFLFDEVIYAYAGPVVRLLIGGDTRDCMLCNDRFCKKCNSAQKEGKDKVSPTEGMPLVHSKHIWHKPSHPDVLFFEPPKEHQKGVTIPAKEDMVEQEVIFKDGMSRAVKVCVEERCSFCKAATDEAEADV